MSATSGNMLEHANSTYLRQHARNPVHWVEWSEDAWTEASRSNRLVLVSIGYASCHWCHVMEHESFENAEVAALMNEHFVCIKVDREERPDVDHVYMSAVTMMTGHGGWPLNCFCLPDGRPLYAGTYFPRDRWMQVLSSLSSVYATEPERALRAADEAVLHLRQREVFTPKLLPSLSLEPFVRSFAAWSRSFDTQNGGDARAPKFPMPCTLRLLLRAGNATPIIDGVGTHLLHEHVHRTLMKMSFGGIYDHVQGGFARYSTDLRWKVPHFEKMLYDNAQLIAVYAEAFQSSGITRYKEVVEGCIGFVEQWLRRDDGLFFAAIDADAGGREGSFSVWTLDELRRVLSDDCDVFCLIYSIRDGEVFEDDAFILHRIMDDDELCSALNLSIDDLHALLARCHGRLREAQRDRTPPQRDDNIIVSWNALMVSAYAQAFRATGNHGYRDRAVALCTALLHAAGTDDGSLLHTIAENQRIPGFLEDYAFVIQALTDVHSITMLPWCAEKAMELAHHVHEHFRGQSDPLYDFSSRLHPSLFMPTVETYDNVTPASNSALANALFDLGILCDNEDLVNRALNLLAAVTIGVQEHPAAFAHWTSLYLRAASNPLHVSVCGPAAEQDASTLLHYYDPNLYLSWKTAPASETRFSVCDRNSCLPPFPSLDELNRYLTSRS